MGHKIEFWGLEKNGIKEETYTWNMTFLCQTAIKFWKSPLIGHGFDTEPDQQTFCVCQVQYYDSTSKIIVMNGLGTA